MHFCMRVGSVLVVVAGEAIALSHTFRAHHRCENPLGRWNHEQRARWLKCHDTRASGVPARGVRSGYVRGPDHGKGPWPWLKKVCTSVECAYTCSISLSRLWAVQHAVLECPDSTAQLTNMVCNRSEQQKWHKILSPAFQTL